MKTISFCLIARNEESVIGRCLASVKPYADEIILIDTGSTDKTKEIARQYGAKVYDFQWCDDFSAARNEFFKYATCDFIFSIDCDEYIAPTEKMVEQFKKVKEGDLAMYMILIASITDKGEIVKSSNYRLFPNDKRLSYHFIVHENIGDPQNIYKDKMRGCGILLLHTGYLGKEKVRKGSENRNIKLIRRQLELLPNHPYFLYQAGVQYYGVGMFNEARDYYKKTVDFLERNPEDIHKGYLPLAYEGLLASYLSLNDEEGIKTLLDIDTINPNFYINLTNYYIEKKDYRKALITADKSIECCRYANRLIAFEEGTVTWKPYMVKGKVYLAMKDDIKALDCFRLAHMEDPKNIKIMSILTRQFAKLERYREAEDFANRVLEKNKSIQEQLHLADIYLNTKRYKQGLDLYFKLASPEHLLALSEAYRNSDKPEVAVELKKYIENHDYVHIADIIDVKECTTIIIPTLMKVDKEVFFKSLEIYNKCPEVKSIIIIDNTEDKQLRNFKKLDKAIILTGENLYVNPAWNKGISLCDTPYYLLVNDDVIADGPIIKECCSVLESDSSVGLLLAKTINGNNDNYELLSQNDNNKVVYVNVPINFVEGGWFMFGRKEDWIDIPEDLKYFYGDNWIYENIVFKRKKKIAKIVSSCIRHNLSTTVKSERLYEQGILESEGKIFEKYSGKK